MDLRRHNTFILAAELSIFTKAVDRLGFSQPIEAFQTKQFETLLGFVY